MNAASRTLAPAGHRLDWPDDPILSVKAPTTRVMTSEGTPQSRRLLVPDWQWMIILASASIGFFLTTVAAATTFFFPNNLGPSIAASTVWTQVAIFAVQAVPLLWRTRNPLLCYLLVYAFFIASVAFTVDRNLTVSPTLLFALFSLTASTSFRVWGPTAAITAGIDLILFFVLAYLDAGELPPIAILAIVTRFIPTYPAAILGGLAYGAQRQRAELAMQNAIVLRQAADSQLDAAVASERNRMARELHDVAAHHISGILVQTKAAIRVRESNPQMTKELLESISSEGEMTLQNLRAVVGVFRDEDDGSRVSQPTLSRLPDLIASVRALHPQLTLTVHGEIDDLSPATSLACYRIVQESLTNVRKHAPNAEVCIDIWRTRLELVIDVENAASPRPPSTGSQPGIGHGILGMGERASMLGGSLQAGRTESGGWKVHAAIPVQRRAVA